MRIAPVLAIPVIFLLNGAGAQTMLEQAFRTKDLTLVEGGFSPTVTMRLGDSLYVNVGGIEAMNLLHTFLADRDSIRLRFTSVGKGSMAFPIETGLTLGPIESGPMASAIISGTMMSTLNGRRETVPVDAWFREGRLLALNISNYPLATVFFDIRSGAR